MSTSASGARDPRAEAVTRLEHVIDELGELLLDQFYWKRTEAIALASSDLRAEPFFISWIGTGHYRRAAAAVRAMIDPGMRGRADETDSLVTIMNAIADDAALIDVFPAVPRLRAADGRLDAAEVRQDVAALVADAEAVKEYVNKYLAHLDRNPKAPIPTAAEIDTVIEKLKATAHEYYLALTGTDYEIEPKVLFDWTGPLLRPWIRPKG